MLNNRIAPVLAFLAISIALLPSDGFAINSPRESWGLQVIWGNKTHDEAPQVRGGYITPEWADVNPAPGVYDFSRLDEELARYHSLGKQVTVAIRGTYKPDYLFAEVPYHPEQLSLQVKDKKGSLQYWHPQFRLRHRQLLEAFANYVENSPHRSAIYSIRQNLNALGTEHSGIEDSDQARSKWVIPAGVEFVPFTDNADREYKLFVSQMYYDLFVPDHLVLVRSVLLTDSNPDLPDDVIRAIKLGQMGIWHSTSVPEPYSRSTEKKYEVHYQYGRDGRTPVYAEPFSSSTKGSRGDLPPAQWNYWRILSDLHAGVTFISVYGSDIEQYNDAEYAAAFDFTNRYAGYQTGDNATLSPGAWVALRDGSSDYLGGDYTFLMHRMAGDPSTDLSGVGPSWQRYGAWARRVPADGRMRFQVDDRFANTVSGQDMVLRVTYFDSRNPRFSVTAGGNKQTFRGSAKGIWMTIDMPLGPIDFSAESGADITLSATTDVTIHMVELVRSADAVADSKRPEPPMDVQ